MDDFLDDDALLAMVGDESEGKDEAADSTSGDRERSSSPAAARSPTPEQSSPRESTETSKTQPRRGVATKMPSKGTARRRKTEESDREDEASSLPGSPVSLGSDAMDESDSDASPAEYLDATTNDVPYPLEGKYKNAADKAYVLSLTEVEREQVLAEREEEAAAKRREMQLKNLLDSKEAEKSRKRKAAAEMDDERRPSRAKTSREKVLDAYKTQREQAKEGGRRRQLGRSTRRSRSRSVASSRDASGSPDIEYPVGAPQKETDQPAELADIERIRVGRTRLAKVCFFPKFEETMIGCFVRVCIGQDANRQPEYRMTVIKSIVTGTPYLVDASPAVQPFYTDQYVLLAHGKAQKQWSFMHCSDSKFTEKEFNRWKQQLTVTDGLPLTMKSETDKICAKINALLDHHLTSEEINEKIAKREKYKHLFATSAASAPVKRTQSDDAAEKLRLRNEKIRKQNTADVRKALVAEQAKRRARMKAQMAQSRPAASNTATPPAADTSNSLAVPSNDFDDLFSGGSDVSRAASPAVGSPAPAVQNSTTSVSQSGTNTPHKHKPGRFTKMTMDDDIISSMDLAIDIEI
ncbi:hypothetical protein, variant [Verruconis gallopava]|uniref:Plus3 domain-containing protein n=1 Tax=Verruconis gallopava TaxID=253628 RepID=A0A0D2AL05_9PEZI|nr:uncharacterized protein PV09_01428 [Verruconis gallopava]XP_016217327.1 hypothetical protein, variant [Verruconis gallopava]KIW07457.1 hypothetical protein PV09_01428 [Verruconis gallopava]KIW07458.1 hypothetical protein, variant [Verruconis gallopava]